ncbi:MAG: YggT family protein [Bacillota bacterium]
MGLIVYFVNIIFEVYMALILARVLLSWVRHNPYQPIIKFIYETTDPVLGFFRRLIPPIGMVDISPIAAFFVLSLVRSLIINILYRLG